MKVGVWRATLAENGWNIIRAIHVNYKLLTEKETRFQPNSQKSIADSHESARFASFLITTLSLLFNPITNYNFCWNRTQLKKSRVIREVWPFLSASQQMKCGRAPYSMVWIVHSTSLLEYCKLTLYSPYTLNCSFFYSSQYPCTPFIIGMD